MLGRTFEALEECDVSNTKEESEHKGLQMGLPACTKLVWVSSSDIFYDVSCPNVQTLHLNTYENDFPSFEVSPKLLYDALFNYSCLQTLNIAILHYSGVRSLIHLIFCDSWERGVWKNIRRVDMAVRYNMNGLGELFNEMVWCQQHYAKGWRKFMVSYTADYSAIKLWALM